MYNLNYPLLKIKWILRHVEHNIEHKNKILTTFNALQYQELNPDLAHLNKEKLRLHYIHIGIKEGRIYLPNVLKQVGKEPIRKILNDHNILHNFE